MWFCFILRGFPRTFSSRYFLGGASEGLSLLHAGFHESVSLSPCVFPRIFSSRDVCSVPLKDFLPLMLGFFGHGRFLFRYGYFREFSPLIIFFRCPWRIFSPSGWFPHERFLFHYDYFREFSSLIIFVRCPWRFFSPSCWVFFPRNLIFRMFHPERLLFPFQWFTMMFPLLGVIGYPLDLICFPSIFRSVCCERHAYQVYHQYFS